MIVFFLPETDSCEFSASCASSSFPRTFLPINSEQATPKVTVIKIKIFHSFVSKIKAAFNFKLKFKNLAWALFFVQNTTLKIFYLGTHGGWGGGGVRVYAAACWGEGGGRGWGAGVGSAPAVWLSLSLFSQLTWPARGEEKYIWEGVAGGGEWVWGVGRGLWPLLSLSCQLSSSFSLSVFSLLKHLVRQNDWGVGGEVLRWGWGWGGAGRQGPMSSRFSSRAVPALSASISRLQALSLFNNTLFFSTKNIFLPP